MCISNVRDNLSSQSRSRLTQTHLGLRSLSSLSNDSCIDVPSEDRARYRRIVCAFLNLSCVVSSNRKHFFDESCHQLTAPKAFTPTIGFLGSHNQKEGTRISLFSCRQCLLKLAAQSALTPRSDRPAPQVDHRDVQFLVFLRVLLPRQRYCPRQIHLSSRHGCRVAP